METSEINPRDDYFESLNRNYGELNVVPFKEAVRQIVDLQPDEIRFYTGEIKEKTYLAVSFSTNPTPAQLSQNNVAYLTEGVEEVEPKAEGLRTSYTTRDYLVSIEKDENGKFIAHIHTTLRIEKVKSIIQNAEPSVFTLKTLYPETLRESLIQHQKAA